MEPLVFTKVGDVQETHDLRFNLVELRTDRARLTITLKREGEQLNKQGEPEGEQPNS